MSDENPLASIERENVEAARERSERENDEYPSEEDECICPEEMRDNDEHMTECPFYHA